MKLTRAPPASKRIRDAGYHEPVGILEHIQYTLLENSFQHDDQTELLRQLLAATHTTNTLLQSLVTQQQNSPKTAVSLSHETLETPKRSLERESLQLQKAVAWLIANDTDLKLSTRQAEKQSGISKATINRAQQWIKEERTI